jgi:predicted 3-demethylubiquinone-9 3-methyltransferase (glyoxalase superfamily)
MDRFGLSWQLSYRAGSPIGQKIIPTLMFAGEVCGKAEEALSFYASVFREARAGDIFRHDPGAEPNRPDMVKHADFWLAGQEFAAMDSALEDGFYFNEAISFMVYCDGQEEIDHFWGKLSARPEAEQCGWLKDRYGLSWQILPRAMDEMMGTGSPEQLARVTAAFLAMKKFELAALERAFRGD